MPPQAFLPTLINFHFAKVMFEEGFLCLSKIKKNKNLSLLHGAAAPNVFTTSGQLPSLPCFIRNWLDLQSWQIL